MIPVFLLILIILSFVIRYEISKNKKSQREITDAFWDKERQANTTPKKDISNLDFITIPAFLSSNSGLEDEEILETEKKINSLSEKKIVNFNGMTNTDLKLAYGTANFPFLSEYDNNFMLLVRLLNKYGKLLKNQQPDRAIMVLEFAIEIGSDIADSYRMLGEMYKASGKPEKIGELITKAEALNSLTKNKLIIDLNEML